jgi:hypothetical protein
MSEIEQIKKLYLNIKDITTLFNFSATTWRKLVREGKAPKATISRHNYAVWRKNDIMQFELKFGAGEIDF